MDRIVTDETLDGLAEHDPQAIQSRRDLQRIHLFMGTRGLLVQALPSLRAARPVQAPLRVLELGAGDGSLMLGVARALKGESPAVELTLLDRQNLVSSTTIANYASLGWVATPKVMDVLDWAADDFPAKETSPQWDVIVANLFLHHFEGDALERLLAAIESRTGRFFACEPHRARLALVASCQVPPVYKHVLRKGQGISFARLGAIRWATGDPVHAGECGGCRCLGSLSKSTPGLPRR